MKKDVYDFEQASKEMAEEFGFGPSEADKEHRRITHAAKAKRKRKRKQSERSRRQNRPKK